MKTPQLRKSVKYFGTAITALSFATAAPLAYSDEVEVEIGDTEIEVEDGRVEIERDGDEVEITPEVSVKFVEGYVIPEVYRTRLTTIPMPEQEGVTIRYYGGRAYFVDTETFKIIRAVPLHPSKTVVADLVEGSTVPETYRTRLVDVPLPEEEDITIRYINGRICYVNPETFEIVRVLPLPQEIDE